MKFLILATVLFAQFAHSESEFSRRERERYNDQIAAQNNAPLYQPPKPTETVIYQSEAPVQLYRPTVRCYQDPVYQDQVTCVER